MVKISWSVQFLCSTYLNKLSVLLNQGWRLCICCCLLLNLIIIHFLHCTVTCITVFYTRLILFQVIFLFYSANTSITIFCCINMAFYNVFLLHFVLMHLSKAIWFALLLKCAIQINLLSLKCSLPQSQMRR